MDKITESIAATQKEDNPHFINRMIKIVAYPISLAAGFLVTNTSVRDSAYQKAKKRGGFDDIEIKFGGKDRQDLVLKNSQLITQEEWLERAIKNKLSHSAAVQEKMEELGINRFASKWKYINRGNKQKAIIDGLTVAGISIGAILTIANTKSLTEFFFGESKNNGQDR